MWLLFLSLATEASFLTDGVLVDALLFSMIGDAGGGDLLLRWLLIGAKASADRLALNLVTDIFPSDESLACNL